MLGFPRYAVIFMIAGCASAPIATRYYLLTMDLPTSTVQGSATAAFDIAVGPVIVPDYLDQPLIVTRNNHGVLSLGENDRWASPLSENIQELLISRLAARLPGTDVAAFPTSQAFGHDYRVVVEIVRLDGRPGHAVKLEARFRIIETATGQRLYEQRFEAETPIAGVSFQELVTAESTAVAALADTIVEYFGSRASKELQPSPG